MGAETSDQELIKLLTKLKEADPEYPQDLLAARRQQYLRRMAEVELGIPRVEVKPEAESNFPSTPATFNSTLLETILVVAIAIEAIALAYFNRDKLAELLQTITTAPEVQEIVTSPETMTVAMTEMVSPSPVATSTILSPTVPVSPTENIVTSTQTPAPEALAVTVTNSSSESVTQVAETPVPNGNNGNHYGQTPKPERTKENNGNGPP